MHPYIDDGCCFVGIGCTGVHPYIDDGCCFAGIGCTGVHPYIVTVSGWSMEMAARRTSVAQVAESGTKPLLQPEPQL